MVLSALAGPTAPIATGAFYATSSYDEFLQKAREELGPVLEKEFINQGNSPDEAKVKANSIVDSKTADAAFLNALLQGTLDAASQYVFMGVFPKVGGKIAGNPAFRNALSNALLKLKKSPAADTAVRFFTNWAFEQGTEEAQNIGQRALEIKADIKGSGLTPWQEASAVREETAWVTGIMLAIGFSGNVDISPTVVKDIQGKINAALKDPTPQKRLDVVNSISKIDARQAADVNRVLDAYNDAIIGASREDVQKKLKKVKNPELLAGAEKHIDGIFNEKEGRIVAEQKVTERSIDSVTGLKKRALWIEEQESGNGRRPKYIYETDVEGLGGHNFGLGRATEGDMLLKLEAAHAGKLAAGGEVFRPDDGGDEMYIATDADIPLGRQQNPHYDAWVYGKGRIQRGGGLHIVRRVELKPGEKVSAALARMDIESKNHVKQYPDYGKQKITSREEVRARLEKAMQGMQGKSPVTPTTLPVKPKKQKKGKAAEVLLAQQEPLPEVQPAAVVEPDNPYMGMPLERVQIDAEKGVVAAKRALTARQNEPTTGRATVGANATSFAEPFYSKLEKAIQDKMPASMSVDGLSGLIANSGIKQDEMNFSGMVDFLQQNKGKTITKEQVEKFLNDNRVTVKVEHLGGEQGALVNRSFDDPEIAGPISTLRRYKLEPALNPIPELAVGFIPEDGNPIQSSDFKNAAEIGENDLNDLIEFTFGKKVPKRVVDRVVNAMEIVERYIGANDSKKSTMYENWKLPGGKNYTEVLVSWNQKDSFFAAPHFGGKGENLLYHIRMNERIVNGKKMLFVEEIQSDWHQFGRKRGYGKKTFKDLSRNEREAIVQRELNNNHDYWIDRFSEEDENEGVGLTGSTLAGLIEDALDNDVGDGVSEDSQVPPAPLSKNWHEQAMKRVIRYAAEKGMDGIAWTTGDTQNERWRKAVLEHVDKITWGTGLVQEDQEESDGLTFKQKDPIKLVDVWKDGKVVKTFHVDPDDNTVLEGGTPTELSEIFGNEMAKQITSKDEGELEGDDIAVGGYGMRGFYDKMLVDYANKLGRKYGVKVQEGTTSTTPDKIKVNFKVPTDPGTLAMIDMPPFDDGTPPMSTVTTMYVDGRPETVDVFIGGDGVNIMSDNGGFFIDTKYFAPDESSGESAYDAERTAKLATKALEDPNSPIWQNFQILQGYGPAEKISFLPTDKKLEATHVLLIPENMRSDVLYVGQEFFMGMPLGQLFTEGVYTKFFDRYAPIENIWKKAEKEYGGALPHGMNLMERAREYLGIAGKVTATLNDATFTIDPEGNIEKTGEGLRPIIQDYQVISRGGDENLNDMGLYLEAQRTIADARLNDQGEKRVTLEGGADPYQVMKDLRDKYGNDLDQFDDIAQRVYGYQDRVLHLLVDSGILSQEQFDKIKKDNPSYIPFDRIIDKDFFIGGPVAKKAFTEAKNPLRMIKGSELPIVNPFESIIKNTFLLLDRAERNQVAKSLAQLKNLVPDDISVEKIPVVEVAAEGDKSIFRPNRFSPPRGVIEYYDGGVRKWLKIDNENLYNAMSGLSETQVGFMVKLLSKPSNWLRTGVVISPEFWARNSIRDQFTAFLQTDFNPKSLFDTVGSIADILGKRETYYDWLRSGGAYSGFVDVNRDNLVKILEDVKKDPNLIWKLNILQTAQDISSVIENATRLGVYKRAKIRGKSDVEAGFRGREATVDFARRGTMMKEINALWAFFNPSLQGVDKFMRTMRDKPKETTLKALATITLPSVLLWAINNDDDEYKEMAPWLKDLFWNFKIGGAWYRVPKPYMYGQLFGSSVERFLDYLKTKDLDAIKQFRQSIIDAASPIQGDETGILMPTAARPLIENATNWSFFRQAPLVGGTKAALAPPLQYGAGTTEAAKKIGGLINYSPAKLENLVRGWTGTTGYDMLKLASLVMDDKKPKPPKQASDYFFVKGFTSRNPMISPESGNRFYGNWATLDSEYKSYNKYIDLGEIQRSNEINKKYKDIELVHTIVGRAKLRLNDIDDEIDRVPLEIQDEKEQRKKLAELYYERVEIYRLANQVMKGKVAAEELQNRGMTNEPSERPPKGLGFTAPPTPRIGRP